MRIARRFVVVLLVDDRVDFTTAGAELYRRIMSAWHGDDWEDGLFALRGIEWETHHYCTTEAGFFEQIADHQNRGEIVRGIRIEQIGPWCVKWWERFPSGYRLELDLTKADPQSAHDQRTRESANRYASAEFMRYCLKKTAGE